VLHRRIATHLAVLIVGLVLGVGAIAVAGTHGSPTATAASANRNPDVVRELRTLETKIDTTNHRLDVVNENLGGSSTYGNSVQSLHYLLQQIQTNTRP
jgi:hypothetical protein